MRLRLRVRVLLPLLVIVVATSLAACGDSDTDESGAERAQLADLGADPQIQETDAAPARYRPPAGAWLVRSASLAPGEWYEEYASEDGATLMRVNVFPIRASRAPGGVIRLAIDTFLRSIRVEGFGTGGLRTLAVQGAAGAQTSWTAVVGMQTVVGGARLLRVSDEHWAFAVGYVARSAAKERQPVVRAFLDSLAPATPVFYARRFFDPKDLALVAARPRGEEPVTMRDLLAVELMLEAGVGVRFPLSTRAAVRSALREDLQEKDASTRTAYRETGAAYEKAGALTAEERLQGFRALGGRAMQGLVARAAKGYPPAMRFASVWKRLRAPAVGTQDDGLSVGAVQSLHEMAAFLASLAANREIKTSVERSDRITQALSERWATLPASEKGRLRDAGVLWARLRRRWDASSADQRLTARGIAAKNLAPVERQSTLPTAGDAHALMDWMDAIDRQDALDQLVMRAALLDLDGRRTLFSALGAPDATGWELGW